jgi:hypothetical protein
MEPKQETSPAPNSSPITNFFPKTEKESTPTKLESFDEPMFEFSDGDADDIQVLAINSASTEPKSPSDSKKRKVKDEDCVDAHTIVGNVNTTDNSEQDALLKKLDAFERDYMGTVCTVPIRFRLPSGVVVDYDFPENIPLDKVRWFIEAVCLCFCLCSVAFLQSYERSLFTIEAQHGRGIFGTGSWEAGVPYRFAGVPTG